MSDGTEPAIPVIAPVPLASLQSLLETAAHHWPEVTEQGACVALHVDARGVGVLAELTIHDWHGTLLGRRSYDGQWEANATVTWRPK